MGVAAHRKRPSVHISVGAVILEAFLVWLGWDTALGSVEVV
jgi:hypothetical protein